MRIGVDLRIFQIGHQYRGIGEVAKQCLNRIFEIAVSDNEQSITFVFLSYSLIPDEVDPKQFITIPKKLMYEEVDAGVRPILNPNRSLSEKLSTKIRSLYTDPVPEIAGCDVFLQFDYALGTSRSTATVLVAHDLIPFIFWNDFFESPYIFLRRGALRTTLRIAIHNYESKQILRHSFKNAASILCVSNNTRKDLHRYLHIPEQKMLVVYLGVSEKPASTGHDAVQLTKASLPTKPFLLFIGGIDVRRRRVDELVDAFNQLKGRGRDIQLALIGENFQSQQTIPEIRVRDAVTSSPYNKDIFTLGYVDDAVKQKLMREAIAFVFPTMYEGFGIPVLEAMSAGCPVISYNNSSIPEVGGQYILYADSSRGIAKQVNAVLDMSQANRKHFVSQAEKHAALFSWDKTATQIYKQLIAVVST